MRERAELRDIAPVIIVDYIWQSVEILLSIKQEEDKAKQQNLGKISQFIHSKATDNGDRKLRQLFKKPKKELSKGLDDGDRVN